jgi:hypothetical protein
VLDLGPYAAGVLEKPPFTHAAQHYGVGIAAPWQLPNQNIAMRLGKGSGSFYVFWSCETVLWCALRTAAASQGL